MIVRTLFINQFFVPDGAATAQLLGDVVLAMHGDVSVICGEASYGGLGSMGQREETGSTSLQVWRVRSPGFGHGKLRKLWSYFGFYVRALFKASRGPAPDVVVTMTTPPLLGLIGLVVQRLRGARHFIWEMDVYPDVATELGVFRPGGWRDRVVGWLADWPRRKATGVIALGPCMAKRLANRGVPVDRIHVCPNWADGAVLYPREHTRDGRLKVLYSGNFGLAHDFDTVVEALEALGADPGYSFLFSGGGPRWVQLQNVCLNSGYSSCTFQPFQPKAALSELLGKCDVGLVTQQQGTQGTVVPSKTYGLMAAGRAVVYVGPEDATTATVLNEHTAGWRVPNGRGSDLVTLLRRLRQQPYLYVEAGRRGRAAFELEYDRSVGVNRVIAALGNKKIVHPHSG